jgi:hypothetical protein
MVGYLCAAEDEPTPNSAEAHRRDRLSSSRDRGDAVLPVHRDRDVHEIYDRRRWSPLSNARIEELVG